MAVADGTVVGFVRALSDQQVTTYVAELLVAHAWRGRGIGSALLGVTQRLYPGTRLDLLTVDASGEFYARSGFRSWLGCRRSWAEHDSGEAAS